MKKKILHLLRENARLTNEQLARRMGATPQDVADAIEELESQKAILGYKAIVNPEALGEDRVEAMIEVKVTPKRGQGFDEIARRIGGFPEVKSLYLMSGGSDLLIFVDGGSIKEVAYFVAEKLSNQEDVQSTVTHFVLKEYKKDGTMLSDEGPACRLPVTA